MERKTSYRRTEGQNCNAREWNHEGCGMKRERNNFTLQCTLQNYQHSAEFQVS